MLRLITTSILRLDAVNCRLLYLASNQYNTTVVAVKFRDNYKFVLRARQSRL